jgi:hypothetical protein
VPTLVNDMTLSQGLQLSCATPGKTAFMLFSERQLSSGTASPRTGARCSPARDPRCRVAACGHRERQCANAGKRGRPKGRPYSDPTVSTNVPVLPDRATREQTPPDSPQRSNLPVFAIANNWPIVLLSAKCLARPQSSTFRSCAHSGRSRR